MLGIIDLDGSAHWTELTDRDGGHFRGKIEGLSRNLRDARKVHFVIDDDDETVPSEIFEATLSDGFFRSQGQRNHAGKQEIPEEDHNA